MRIFVAGIGTGVGKTMVSAILCEAFEADYWKPVQAGNLDDTDSMTVKGLVSNAKSIIHPEAYRLKLAASPHRAAAEEKCKISLTKMKFPRTSNHLIIEGAGGVLVPLNAKELYIDWIKRMNLFVVLVSQHYLGSINHTLLSIEALKSRGIKVLGIVFNGEEDIATEQVILRISGLKVLSRVDKEEQINKKVISEYAGEIKSYLSRLFNDLSN